MLEPRHFVTLGMFIIDDFKFLDEDGSPTGKELPPQIGGGGTYAALGARIWLPPTKIGMIVDRGNDFPSDIQESLEAYGADMWLFRDDVNRITTRALNSYRGDHRGFNYSTERKRLTPTDLHSTPLERPAHLHFICSPSRAKSIVSEFSEVPDWRPLTIFEPIPDRCVPEELPSLKEILLQVDILSPNAEEALSLLSLPLPPTRRMIETACNSFLEMGVGPERKGHVVIRSGAMGAYVASLEKPGRWIDAYWTEDDIANIVDVTGAGNSFLGGLSAGILLTNGDVFQAVLHATVSASFTIEQLGLPRLTTSNESELWNDGNPYERLEYLQRRHESFC